jgi:hypothetical protein
VTVHASRPGDAAPGAAAKTSALLAVVGDGDEASRAIAAGVDLIDVTGLGEETVARIRAAHPGARLWTGSPAAVDADGAATGGEASPAAAVAAAAISTWLGAPAVRSRHVVAVRRSIDMTLSIAGRRLPALTTRGLA